MMTFGEMIFWHASRNPEKPAVIGPGRVMTYAVLKESIGSCALRLQSLGWAPGGTVAILVGDRIAHIVLAAALGRLGFVTMAARDWRDIAEGGVALAGVLSSKPAPPGNQLPFVQIDPSWITPNPAVRIPPQAAWEPHALHHIAFTSGSTGHPKPIGYDVNAVRENQIGVAMIGHAIAWDRLLSIPSLQGFFGYALATMALYLGKTLVFAESYAECMLLTSIFGVDWIVASNLQLEGIIKQLKQQPSACPTLRLVYFGGSLVTQELLQAARAGLSAQVVCGYGSTESGIIAAAPAERLPLRTGATGFVCPWTTVEVLDADGSPLPAGREGVLRIRTPAQGLVFNRATGAFEALDPDSGWAYPGDLGIVEPDGMLVITGRANEVINSGGVKFAPEVLEQTLLASPGVVEAAVVTLTDPFGLEKVWAAVVAAPSADHEALRQACLERMHKVLKVEADHIVFVDAIPKTDLGKVARHAVRTLLAARRADPN